tara:strand:- start:289 stop:528 length:240 start_codon:yes stop_codon:yes gene_type:complete
VKIFWPHRSKVKGFLTKKVAFKYPEKISSLSSSKISKKNLAEKSLNSINENRNQIEISALTYKRLHWANRDFSEYRKAS